MTLSTYSGLQSAVADWLEREDLTTRIPDFINLAEAQINRALRLRQMVRRSAAVIADAYSAAPPDLIEVVSLTLDGLRIEPAPPETLTGYASSASGAGRPRMFALVGEEIRYWPPPDRAYGAELTYFARIPALSDSVISTWLLAEAPDVYLYGALLQAAPYLHDSESAASWGQLYIAALDALRQGQRTAVGALRTELAPLLSTHNRPEGSA